MIDKATAERIKDAADIVEVVSDYVHLVRRGANYMGLCPFHNERTPSFSVNKRKNFCFCFSCKQGGSPVNFIMKKEGLSYHDALLHLAKKYGIEVQERELTDEERREQSEREAMLVANEWAMQKMHQDLIDTQEGKDIGLQYLYQRGVTQEAINAFRLGYAIDKGSELVNAALKAGFDIEVLKKLGLVGTSQKGNDYDRFRGRVIFPVMNSAGKVVAFGGRDLKGGMAKYINSPESQLYKKSNELYGIYQARTQITKDDKCYLVEGYLDVIGMWQSGMKNVVASSGTALTDGQIVLIHRFTENITLIYDGDAAGIKASLRGIDMLLSHKMKVKVLLLPDGDDPDSFARKHTPEEFRAYVTDHETDIIRFKAGVLMEDVKDPQRRIEAVNSMVSSLAHIPDPVSRDIYIQECSRIMNISEETISKAVIRVRNELSQKWKQERWRAAAGADASPSIGQTPSYPSHESQSPKVAKTDLTPTPASIQESSVKSADHSEPKSKALVGVERKMIQYIVKYAFYDFCYISGVDQPRVPVNVYDWTVNEMNNDSMHFTVPVYDRILTLVESLRSDFEAELPGVIDNADKEVEKLRKLGIDAIASRDLSMSAIEREERKLEDELAERRYQKISDFCRDYASRRLASHEDDAIRECVTELILEKHQLSNIYYRDNSVVETEQDRLTILMERAIMEWRNEILNIRMQDLMQKLKEASDRGDAREQHSLQLKINSVVHMRSQFAKGIGDRILSPVRKYGK